MSDARKPERPILTVSFYLSGTEIEARGMDELRLEEFCSAICRDKGEVYDGEPKVILLEALRNAAEGEGKYIRQTGGSGNYGHVKLRLEPKGEGEGFEFLNEVPEAVLPGEYADAAETGIREAALGGVLFGHEVAYVRATLIDGSFHETDSNPTAFQIAGSMAFKEAAKKASPVLLEPVMNILAVVPETLAGNILEDVNARGGRVEAIKPHERGMTSIEGIVPLRELLRSSFFGRPRYGMRFARYEVTSERSGKSGGDLLGSGVRNPQRPVLGHGSAAAELYFELE